MFSLWKTEAHLCESKQTFAISLWYDTFFPNKTEFVSLCITHLQATLSVITSNEHQLPQSKQTNKKPTKI